MSDLKKLRGQMRQITKEILPDVLSQELVIHLHKEITKHVDARLTAIEKHIRATLEGIEQRTKDTQSYLIRHVTSPQIQAPKPTSEGEKNES